MSTNIVDKDVEIYQRALQRSRDQFYAMDSANAIAHDLGWAKRIVKEAKISENTIPTIFKRVNEESFTIELPCWEDDTNEYMSSNVIVEDTNLDSALVKAKMQGVDEIYIRLMHNYADYMRKAQFSCLSITKQKKKYIVNATIRVPKKEYKLSEDFEENRLKLNVELEH